MKIINPPNLSPGLGRISRALGGFIFPGEFKLFRQPPRSFITYKCGQIEVLYQVHFLRTSSISPQNAQFLPKAYNFWPTTSPPGWRRTFVVLGRRRGTPRGIVSPLILSLWVCARMRACVLARVFVRALVRECGVCMGVCNAASRNVGVRLAVASQAQPHRGRRMAGVRPRAALCRKAPYVGCVRVGE